MFPPATRLLQALALALVLVLPLAAGPLSAQDITPRPKSAVAEPPGNAPGSGQQQAAADPSATEVDLPPGAAARAIRSGRVEYLPPAEDNGVAERFRLGPHRFTYQEQPLPHVSDYLTIAAVTFPSPVRTELERNNTVHCEYYRPRADGPVPAVIVLHILGGDFELSRLFCNALAHHGVAALFLKMPYYGPRRDPESPRRMISPDPEETVEGMTQAVLDIRRAVAWLEAREEVDDERIGIFGISLGGITAALATTAEPRIRKACLVLAGGDLGEVAIDSPRLARVRRAWEEKGGSREEFLKALHNIDPVRYAANARDRKILMLNASRDEVIPKACTESLWQALGRPEIVWYPGGHYSVAWHLLNAIDRVNTFFQPTP